MELLLKTNEPVACILKDEDLYNRWIRDLKSNKYPQISGDLYDETCDGFCAIGLLLRKRIRKNKEVEIYNGERYLFNDITIETEEGYYFDLENFIIELNDYMGWDFQQIAQLLEGINEGIKNGQSFYRSGETLSFCA